MMKRFVTWKLFTGAKDLSSTQRLQSVVRKVAQLCQTKTQSIVCLLIFLTKIARMKCTSYIIREIQLLQNERNPRMSSKSGIDYVFWYIPECNNISFRSYTQYHQIPV
jgi:hypothetical protein